MSCVCPVLASALKGPSPNEFVAVRGGGDTTSAEALLVAAYVIMWLLALLVVYLTWRKQNALDRRLAELERALQASLDDGDSADASGEA